MISEKFINRLFIALAVVNCIVVVIFEVQRRPRIERVDHYFTTNHVIVVTNYMQSATSDSRSAIDSVSSVVAPQHSVRYRYTYFVHGGTRFAAIPGNEYLSRGSPTSYGRISEIYPDRILLENGVWLVNDSFAVRSSPVADPIGSGSLATQQKGVQNDGI